jgi:hypothetical protein
MLGLHANQAFYLRLLLRMPRVPFFKCENDTDPLKYSWNDV